MRAGQVRPPAARPRRSLVDRLLAIYAILVLGMFITDLVEHYKDHVSLLERPPIVLAALSFPIILRLCVTDFVNQRLQFTLAMWRDNALVPLAFALIIAMNLFSVVQPDANLQYQDGKAAYILVYRFVMFGIGMMAALLLVGVSWRACCLVAFLVLVGSVAYEVQYPDTFSIASGRAAGFPHNPNLTAVAIVMLCAVVVRYERLYFFDILIAAVGGLAVFTTLSRGGAGLYAVFLLSYLYQVLYHAKQHRTLGEVLPALFVVAAMSVVAVFCASLLSSSSSMFDTDNAQRRLATFTLQDQAVYETDSTRLSLVPKYLDKIDRQVFFGYGAGYSRSLNYGPHNTYLVIWVNNGLLGMAAYIGLLLAAYRIFARRRFVPGKIFMLISFLAGFLSHSMLGMSVFLILLGLCLGASWCERTPVGRRYAAVASGLRPTSASVGGLAMIPSYWRLLPRLPGPLPGRRSRSSP